MKKLPFVVWVGRITWDKKRYHARVVAHRATNQHPLEGGRPPAVDFTAEVGVRDTIGATAWVPQDQVIGDMEFEDVALRYALASVVGAKGATKP